MRTNLRRFFHNNEADAGRDFRLEGGEHNHLANALRMRVGERVIVVVGDDYDYEYEIESIGRDGTDLIFIERRPNKSNPRVRVAMYLGIIKQDNLTWVVEKLNEIGISDLFLFTCFRTNVAPRSVNVDKLQVIANQSCKQCGRSEPMEVHEPITFDQMLLTLDAFENVLYADRGEKRDKIRKGNIEGRVGTAIIIGPEGGFDIDENLAITERGSPVTLGARTLRSETAAIVASTVVLNKLGEI